MRKILILSNDSDWRKNLAARLRQNPDVFVTIAQGRSDAISNLTSEEISTLLIDDTYQLKDIEIVAKYIASKKNKITVFFLSKDFEIFKDVLKILSTFTLDLVDLPVPLEELAAKIERTLFTINPQSAVDRQVHVNIQFLKIFTDATKKILTEFCSIQEIQFQKPKLIKNEPFLPYAIRGQIDLASELFQGAYYIHFDQRTYLKIVNKLLMTEDKEITDENKDFAGEIVNMIYGQAKIDLNLGGYNFDKAFPKYSIMPDPLKTNYPVVQLMIHTEEGEIELLIEIRKMQGYVL